MRALSNCRSRPMHRGRHRPPLWCGSPRRAGPARCIMCQRQRAGEVHEAQSVGSRAEARNRRCAGDGHEQRPAAPRSQADAEAMEVSLRRDQRIRIGPDAIHIDDEGAARSDESAQPVERRVEAPSPVDTISDLVGVAAPRAGRRAAQQIGVAIARRARRRVGELAEQKEIDESVEPVPTPRSKWLQLASCIETSSGICRRGVADQSFSTSSDSSSFAVRGRRRTNSDRR